MKPVCPEEIVVYAGGEQNYSREYRCHDQLVAQRFYIYYTQLLHVSTKYSGHRQGVVWLTRTEYLEILHFDQNF